MLVALDCETTGLDFWHGARPFFVTACDSEGNQAWWEWHVDPKSRRPRIPPKDVEEIQALLDTADEIVGQNIKFDALALSFIGIEEWPWHKTHDTLIAGHLLASNQPHNLTAMTSQYLRGLDISPFEDSLEEAVKNCRNKVRSKSWPHGNWAIAKQGRADMPSAEKETWRFDYWLPKAYAEVEKLEEDHPYRTVLREYSNTDSAVTVALWQVMKERIKKEGLWPIYAERMKAIPVAVKVEKRGITVSAERLDTLRHQYAQESEEAGCVCRNIASNYDYDLELPKSGNNDSLKTFVFDVMKLPVVAKTDTGGPALDSKVAIPIYKDTLKPRSREMFFITSLEEKRKRDTATQYMDSYRRFWKAVKGEDDWYVLHPVLKPTGTDTLRWSSSNPNSQNISKK
jgi:DNA polymerase I-like protein with 3'-5' exonuclease and polymerase domains